MIQLLAGDALRGVENAGHTLQSQTRALKWQIDDLLVSAGSAADARHLALSCKSNAQVSKNGLPADFVKRAWEQWRDPGSPMRRETDVLALVTRGHQPSFTPQWTNIVEWCSGEDPQLAIARIRETNNHTRIFESIKAPGGTEIATDEETVGLIRHLAVIPLDFQLEPSRCREEAIGNCRRLLQSGDRREAERVWTDLERMATETRVGSGTLTLSEVWAKLRTTYSLNDQPNFEGSWKALRALTQDYKSTIETALPSGFIIERRDDKTRIAESIRDQSITAVFGESGSGKSALVKATLDGDLATYNQVWLGPEQAEAATSELNRARLQLAQPLHDVLQSSASPRNVLVIDSAERLNANALPRVKQLIERLVSTAVPVNEMPWRVVFVSQPEGWRDRIHMMIGQPVERPIGVENIPVSDVKAALWASQGLGWLSFQDHTVAAIRNLRTLAWVIQAATVFKEGSAEIPSPPAIADRIWEFWTEEKTTYHNLLIRLAERDAEFERSFAVSEMTPAEVQLFQQRPAHLPLRKNKRSRIEFQHDLAADWARFQRLKELSDDVEQWAALASNPLWNGALRLLGQFLLREPAEAGSEWDHAFSALEEKGERYAADALLDALCLDPRAEKFLEDRAELLFANCGKLLNRLLRRFLHIATVPNAPREAGGLDRALALYVEAKYRMPIPGFWPPLAGFLYAHLKQMTDLVSPVVAEVCEVWLTTTPPQLQDGIPMPLRREFAEVALATARALQVEQGKGRHHFGDDTGLIYSAALASGWDLPDEVATWALEMAQRRPQSEEVASRIAVAKANAAAEHAERLRTDLEFRAYQLESEKRRALIPYSFSASPRKLPPWPMGPKSGVERDFRKVLLHTKVLEPLMNLRPKLAAEIMLAALIESNPTAEYSETMRFENVGLQYDGGDSYPTIFWKSQFFSFLQIAPDAALTTLIQLVNFATERWAFQWNRGGSRQPPKTTLIMRNGSRKSYVGDYAVFDWTQANSNFIGQLHCALNALERWLTLQNEQGVDVRQVLERLLEEGRSLAFVGLLVNVAKHRPVLLSGPLLPVLSSNDVYRFDNFRVEHAQLNFDAFAWSRSAEAIFDLARDWTNAPYREQGLVQVAVKLIPRDKAIASFLKIAIDSWDKPDDPKQAIEFDILYAQLDEANYQLLRDPETGEENVGFEYPEAVKEAYFAYEKASAPTRQKLLFSFRCEQVLGGQAALSELGPQHLAGMLRTAPTEDEPDDEGRQALNRLAAAATLVACARDWLDTHPAVGKEAKLELDTTVDSIGDSAEELRRFPHASSDEYLKFAAYGVFHLWLHDGRDEPECWERALLRVLTSGDDQAAGVLGSLAYRHRMELGERWWRLLQIAVLWSALSMFGPGFDDPSDIGLHWQRWARWLRSRRISGQPADASSVDLLSTWRRLQRLERGRWHRELARDESSVMELPNEHASRGLGTGFLNSFFGWLLADNAQPREDDFEIGRQVLMALWSYEAAYCSERRDKEGEYRPPYEFGYNVLAKLAFYAGHVWSDQAAEIWRGVLGLGPAAHYLLRRFVGAWFAQPSQGCNSTAFCTRWRGMIEFALDENWDTDQGHWFHKHEIQRKLLGFGSEGALSKLPNAAQTVFGMRDLYQRWAQDNLRLSDENVAQFSLFLASEVGALLRVDGLKWLAQSIHDASNDQYWRDREGTGGALVDLLDTTLLKNTSALRKDQEARDAFIVMSAHLATRHVSGALVLQERIRQVR